jgi:uncharacterized repeat protein (TIGR03803 family)
LWAAEFWAPWCRDIDKGEAPARHDGDEPGASVTFGPDGNLYGTTEEGGLVYGTVYKLSPPPSVCKTSLCPWVETILYQFSGGSDGKNPNGPVTFDQAGNLYGVTGEGGTANEGVVYEVSQSQSGWTESVLHSFTGAPDGKSPSLNLVFDSAGTCTVLRILAVRRRTGAERFSS